MQACSKPTFLYYLDGNKKIYACGDASNDGWGFIIFQLLRDDLPPDDLSVDANNNPIQGKRIIAINSGSFNKEQRKWSTTDQECYAFYKGIMDNKHLLFCRPFHLITDHLNLVYLTDSESDRVQRYKMALQVFTIIWVHGKGKGPLLLESDMLSRIVHDHTGCNHEEEY